MRLLYDFTISQPSCTAADDQLSHNYIIVTTKSNRFYRVECASMMVLLIPRDVKKKYYAF
jgi:hypothetical protein